jgi:hypothetical protein
MTLVGQVFAVIMEVVALMQPEADLEAFETGEAIDLPLCENIK